MMSGLTHAMRQDHELAARPVRRPPPSSRPPLRGRPSASPDPGRSTGVNLAATGQDGETASVDLTHPHG